MTATAGKKRSRNTWVSALIAVAILVALGMMLVIGGGIYMVRRYLATTVVAAQDAGAAFDAARAKLANGQPLIELREDQLVVNRTPHQPRQQLSAMHVLAYDPEDRRMVNVTVPGWLLRFAGRGRTRINIDDSEVMREINGHVSLEDLQQHGPGLIVDTTDHGGRRVLVWTE